ncbi:MULTISPECIES: ornithine carbamoyltransferase [unclassified Bacillus (in: firmicutes)]|uniref:ornithine carbamoyltransferase n=1 Tax=unclassified Bacillus (in: firmicutes) TaxID=185979 RepID=UPI0008EF8899|nr:MULTISPECIES: ornithine carbamoyltransferase [unclassified Bacillus (in: firmicutes)]SFA78821.1 ornithine carbamoyltransferase [Bacillus sp. UNCCL13]SFQ68742.1 ornithine carbamoyltransferase [Bacillus sp. cl95]
MIQTNFRNDSLNIKGKDFLSLIDYSPEIIQGLLTKAIKIKNMTLLGESYKPLVGKNLGMIFEKSSTRTRVSFEVGMLQLGGNALYLNSSDLQMGRGESIHDTAKVLSQYLDGIMIRTFSHDIVTELAHYASIPVINGLTDLFHPCQALADLLTIQENKGELAGLKVTYIGDGNNVAHCLMIACVKMGMDFVISCPKGYEPNESVIKMAIELAKENKCTVKIENDPLLAAMNADVLYTDVWTSMGQEKENAMRLEVFSSYQINERVADQAKSDYMFLHCLPAHRGEEVTSGIIDGSHSAVFEQAGNRLHAQKALLSELL